MKKTNIFFATDSTKLFLPWMSMLMSFIAVLVLAAGMTIYTAITNWKQVIAGTLTVQIPTYTSLGESREAFLEKDIETTLTILRSSPGVLGASVISDAKMSELMSPWLNDQAALSELPIPKLIDVILDTKELPDLGQLKADLAIQVPSAILDSHRMQLEPLLKLSTGIAKLIGFILLLLALTASFTVIYATRTSLTAHHHVISLIHLIGANDSFLTRQYAIRNFILAFIGAEFGFLLTLPIMAGISFFLKGVTLDSMFNPSLSFLQWGVLLLVPFGLALLTFITTIKAVLSYLKRFL